MSQLSNVKVEQQRVSRVPINGSDTINLGDNLYWDPTNHCARPVGTTNTNNAAVAYYYLGVANDVQPINSVNENLPFLQVNIVTKGLILFTVDDNSTYYPGSAVTFGAGSQYVRLCSSSGSAIIGYVAAENNFGNNYGSNAGQNNAVPPTPVPPTGAPLATTGIAAVALSTTLLIYIKPLFTSLTSW